MEREDSPYLKVRMADLLDSDDEPSEPDLDLSYDSQPDKSRMDLIHQLTIWKKSGYLLDHISMTQQFLEKLVDYGLFTRPMMDQIHSKGYDVEKKLMMLTLLGQQGKDVYNNFLKILEETKHYKVVSELQKTERFTHFGEMLPPVFTYFLDLSEFLKMYPHIAIKLGEDEKHLLQSYIEGKIEMSTRKVLESNRLLEEQIARLKKKIQEMKAFIRGQHEREERLKQELRQAKEHIGELNKRIKDLEAENFEWKCEVRRLKHFRHEQEELEKFIKDQRKERGLGDMPLEMVNRYPTFINTKNQKAKNTQAVKLKLLSAQVHMGVNKLYYVESHMKQLQYLEKRLNSFVGKPTDAFDRDTLQDLHNIKTLLIDTTKEKQNMLSKLTEEEKEIFDKEREIQQLRQEILGKATTPAFNADVHSNLRTKMVTLLDHLAQLHDELIEQLNLKHFREVEELNRHIEDIHRAHEKDKEVIKWRYRVKMGELHRREMLHRRMKHMVMVICRYHAKNMNATVPVEQCRKIVRAIIGEGRKLRKMIDEAENLEKNPGGDGPPSEEDEKKAQEERERLEREEKEKEEKAKKKKKKRKRDVDYLKNERLMFVADRLFGEWRTLGINIGLSMNRMDIIESEVLPGATPDTLGFQMLRTWRDEIKGKVTIKASRLVKGLLKMGRKDLAIIVLPMHRVELLLSEQEKEEKEEEERKRKEAEEDRILEEARQKEMLLKLQDIEDMDPEQLEREALSLETRRDGVPVLPTISAQS